MVSQTQDQVRQPPKTVISAKRVEIALVSYMDETGRQVTQLALVGENNIHMLDNKEIGFLKDPSPRGLASPWLRDGVLEKLRPESAAGN